MAADRPGMMAHIGQRLERLGGRIEDLSQTVMRGYFTVIVHGRFPNGVTAAAIEEALTDQAEELAVGVRAAPAGVEQRPSGQRLILTARGGDRGGVVGALGLFLADRDINIEDMYARVEPGAEEYVMVLQLLCPLERDLRQLQLDLAELADDLGMTAHLQHENVFLATNEIGAVRALTL